MNVARIYALAFGAVYTLVGLIGFGVSHTMETANLIIFPVNVLHNSVHLLVGLIGLAAYFGGRSVEYSRGMAVVFALLVVVGLVAPAGFGLVPLGGADIVLHAATAILGGIAGWAYSRRASGRVVA